MKKTIILAIAILLAGTATFAQTKQNSKHKTHHSAAKKYTCPMHTEVVRNKPGKCPKCGMALVPMKKKAS
jgi:hypothetical protein